MGKRENILGSIFLLFFITGTIVYFYQGYPQLILWFSNHWTLLLAIACFTRSRFLLQMELNIGLIGEATWIIDFLGKAITGNYIFGATDYMFIPDYKIALYIVGLFHLFVLPLALYLYWKWGSDKKAWKGSLIHYGFLLIFGVLFAQDNLNCVARPCIDFLQGFPYYSFIYVPIMIGLMFATHYFLLFVIKKLKNKRITL